MNIPKALRSATVQAAVLGALITVVGGIGAVVISTRKGDAKLQLVSVELGTPPKEPHLDIKVRNTGDRSGIIKAFELAVTRAWTLRPFSYPNALLLSSGEYRAKIPAKPAPFTVTIPVSQVVDAGAADRFTVLLEAEQESKAGVHRVLLFNAILIYNEGGERLESEPLLLTVGDPWVKLMYCDQMLTHWRETQDLFGDPRPRILENRRIAADIAAIPAKKDRLTPSLLDALTCPMLEALAPSEK